MLPPGTFRALWADRYAGLALLIAALALPFIACIGG